jgi:hypothetical protein
LKKTLLHLVLALAAVLLSACAASLNAPLVSGAPDTFLSDPGYGAYHRIGTTWEETNWAGYATGNFAEIERDATWITLRNASRNLTLRLPVKGGMAQRLTGPGQWADLFPVRPAGPISPAS